MLDENLQAQILWLDGVFLMARKSEKTNIELFSLYNFYAEVFFEGDEPLFIKVFNDVVYLDVYLKMIDINSVCKGINKNQ